MVSDGDRGCALELSLAKLLFSPAAQHIQIIGMSATSACSAGPSLLLLPACLLTLCRLIGPRACWAPSRLPAHLAALPPHFLARSGRPGRAAGLAARRAVPHKLSAGAGACWAGRGGGSEAVCAARWRAARR